MDQGGETDCDDEDDKPDENIQPLNPDILPRGILLAPAEMGRNVTRTPQIIGMRGANEDDEDSESLVEDSKEENQALLEGNTVITSEVSTRRQLATRKRTRKSLSVPARGKKKFVLVIVPQVEVANLEIMKDGKGNIEVSLQERSNLYCLER